MQGIVGAGSYKIGVGTQIAVSLRFAVTLMSAALFRGLHAFRIAFSSPCATCTTRNMRTATAVKFSVPLDDNWEGHDESRYNTSGLVKVPKRDWKTSAPKPVSLLSSRSADVEQELDNKIDETQHPGFLRKKIYRTPTPSDYRAHREALKEAFPEGWSPPHKLSRQAMDGLRVLHMHDPETFTTPVLANKFRISPEAVRRILKSSWEPSPEQRARLVRREMKDKEEWIRQRRLAERKELQTLEQTRINEDHKHGRAVGRNRKDSLSFVWYVL